MEETLMATAANLTDSVPTLGQAAGVYAERAAFGPLQRHFRCTWFHTAQAVRPQGTLIVPDGCMDLLCLNGVLRVAGPDREVKVESIPAGTTVVGLRFQPGAAPAWLRVPMSDIVAARVPLESFWGGEARRLGEWAAEARTAQGVAERLEKALALRAARVDPRNATAHSIFQWLGTSRHPEARIVRELGHRLGWSERSLRRRCHEAFGYGPKTLHRILRFQRFLRLATTLGGGSAAELATEAGYADQPHLIRETRELAGLTPRALVAQLAR
jgi:AraC-like DNA-binding protein